MHNPRTLLEKEQGRDHHANMVAMIRREFPKLTAGRRRYIQNRVARIIRKCGQDVYQVWIGAKPLNEAQYTSDHEFYVGCTKVYVQIQVD